MCPESWRPIILYYSSTGNHAGHRTFPNQRGDPLSVRRAGAVHGPEPVPGPGNDSSYEGYDGLAPPAHVESDVALARILASLLDECEGVLRAVLLFGSRLVQSDPDHFSAYDLVLVVDDYGEFFRRLASAGRLHRSPRLFDLLSRVLAPTNISYRTTPDDPALAKCMILSQRDLERALSPHPPDHFCLGRLVHRVALLYTRGPDDQERMARLLAQGRRTALAWVAPFVDSPFGVEAFTRAMLHASFGGEIRPESPDRPDRVLASQDRFLRSVYGRLLESARDEGLLVDDPGGYRYAEPPGLGQRLRWRIYFRLSRIRSTIRWLKHMITFEEWLDYIQRKVERRMGIAVELTPLDRKLPLIFLWPKVIRVLRARRRAHAKTKSRKEPGRDA